jgi:paraquat-inducible protein B
MIGGFVVGAVALIFASILVFGSGKFLKKTYKFVLYFEGSVSGLSVGAPVVFRGVKIGSVESIVIRTNTKELTAQIAVIIEYEPDRLEIGDAKPDPYRNMPLLIDKGLRAQLQMASLVTGQLMIEFDFHPDTPARLVGGDPKYREIPTSPSTIQEITRTVEKLPLEETFSKLSSAIAGLEEIVNSEDMKGIIGALRVAADEAAKLLKNVDDRVKPLASTIDETLKDYGKLARDVDRQVDPLAGEIGDAVKALTAASMQAEKTLLSIEDVVSEDSTVTTELKNSLRELSTAARSIRVWADYLERNPEALIRGKGAYRR